MITGSEGLSKVDTRCAFNGLQLLVGKGAQYYIQSCLYHILD